MSKSLIFFLPAILLALLFSCNMDGSSGDNTAPTASFATWDYEVSGADAAFSGVNGNYTDTGVLENGVAYYDNSTGYNLFKDSPSQWAIHTSLSDQTYYVDDNGDYPPEDKIWYRASDSSASAVDVTSVPFSGDTSNGGTVTASYVFSDTDGDSEGTSEYQWYRSDTEGGTYSAISGATGTSYTTPSTVEEFYLKFEVTPVDEHGLSGASVLSDPLAIGTT